MTFATTRWSQVIASNGQSDEARRALGWLCEAYWQPLVAHARRCGCDEHAAQDRVQSFFARLVDKRDLKADPARGRFRAYLLGSFQHFLANTRDREGAVKRGGAVRTFSLDGTGE